MFNSHINVEMCSTVKACKYIFKYIFKVCLHLSYVLQLLQGFDKALVEFVERSRISNGTRDGAPSLGAVNVGGHVVLPSKCYVPIAKKAALEREAAKQLSSHNIEL